MFRAIWDQKGEGKGVGGYRFKTMGCYHMKYYLRGKLIANNVVDILPGVMVSNYFFYEPILKNYSIGVFSACLDIEYVRWMSLSFSEFRYYSLSYYIQGYPKLEYKSIIFLMQTNIALLKFSAHAPITGSPLPTK